MNVVASPIDPYASTGQPGQEWTELWEFNGKLRTAIDEPRESTALFETSAKMLRVSVKGPRHTRGLAADLSERRERPPARFVDDDVS